jgi:hypothetical protein
MVSVRRLGVRCTPLALACGLLASPSRAWADDGVPGLTVRAQGVSLFYRDNRGTRDE